MNNIFLIAGGNSTLLSTENFLRQRKEIIKANLGNVVEQIGFVSKENGLPKLAMMGNELCINGTLAFASTLGENGYLKTSGLDEKVFYSNKKDQSTISLELKYTKEKNIVLLPGIGFSFSTTKKSLPKSTLNSFCKKYNLPAFGSISYRNNQLLPFIYVQQTNSLIQESACGSGSIALNILLGISQVTQPTGKIISITRKGNIFSITASVEKIVKV